MTITCDTCGQDSGVRLDDLEALLHESTLEGWFMAQPRMGQPFRFSCPACTKAARRTGEATP
jgi:hypothetical protein